MRENQKKLEKLGISVPGKVNGKRHSWYFDKFNELSEYGRELLLQSFVKDAAEPEQIHTIVLTDEDFSFQLYKTPSYLELLNKRFDLRLVLYLKRQDLWLESWYNQHIKSPWDRKYSSATPQFFIDNLKDFYWIDYCSLVDAITTVVTKDQLRLVPIGKGLVENTLIDFAHFVGFRGFIV